MTSSRPRIAQMSVEVVGSNDGIHSVDRTPAHSSIIRPSRRPSSASDLQQRHQRPSTRDWNSDARTEYGQLSSARRTSVSLLRDFPSVSADVNDDGSDEEDSDEVRRRNLFSERDRRDSTLSKKEIVELSKRLHGDAKRRDSTRLDLSVKAKSKLYTHQPELSPATKQMTVDMAPFRERQETHMLRKQERLVRARYHSQHFIVRVFIRLARERILHKKPSYGRPHACCRQCLTVLDMTFTFAVLFPVRVRQRRYEEERYAAYYVVSTV